MPTSSTGILSLFLTIFFRTPPVVNICQCIFDLSSNANMVTLENIEVRVDKAGMEIANTPKYIICSREREMPHYYTA